MRWAALLGLALPAAACAIPKPPATERPAPGVAAAASAGPARSARSGLPVPPHTGVPRPSGPPGNLKVLDWAGFKAAVSWTFDDAQPSHLAHYAELAALHVPMTFYITVASREKEPGFDETWRRAVRDGNELGNHSVHHCRSDLTGCLAGVHLPGNLASLGEELDGCSAYIRERTGQPDIWTSASPFGDSGYDEPASTRFLVNRGVQDGTIPPGTATYPFDLPTYPAKAGDTADVFSARIDDARAEGSWLTMLIHTITPTDANWYAPVSLQAVTGAMRHAQERGDVWSDTVVAVAAYWRGQQLVATARPEDGAARTATWSWMLPPHFPPGKYLRVTVDGGMLTQRGQPLVWDEHGYYEVALDAGELTLGPAAP